MLTKFKIKIKSLSYILWIILLIIIIISVTIFQQTNKNSQYINLKKTLNNVYLQKTVEKITSELEERYIKLDYTVKEGDSYESIIYRIEIPQNEKKLFLETVKKNKKIKILKPNQKIFFKIDKKNDYRIEKFVVEINKKKKYIIREIKIKIFLNQIY